MLDPNIVALLPNSASFSALVKHSPDLLLDLACHFGGRRIYIPKKPLPNSPLTRALGIERATMVCNFVGYGEITVPLCTAALKLDRNVRIAERKRDGCSVNDLVREFGLHELTIRRALRRMHQAAKRVQVRAHWSGA